MRNGDDLLFDFIVVKFKIFFWVCKVCIGIVILVDVESDEEDKILYIEDDGLLFVVEVVFKVLFRVKGGCDFCVVFKICDGIGDENNKDEEIEYFGLEVLVFDFVVRLDDCCDIDIDLGIFICIEWEDDEVIICKGDVLMVFFKVIVFFWSKGCFDIGIVFKICKGILLFVINIIFLMLGNVVVKWAGDWRVIEVVDEGLLEVVFVIFEYIVWNEDVCCAFNDLGFGMVVKLVLFKIIGSFGCILMLLVLVFVMLLEGFVDFIINILLGVKEGLI